MQNNCTVIATDLENTLALGWSFPSYIYTPKCLPRPSIQRRRRS